MSPEHDAKGRKSDTEGLTQHDPSYTKRPEQVKERTGAESARVVARATESACRWDGFSLG